MKLEEFLSCIRTGQVVLKVDGVSNDCTFLDFRIVTGRAMIIDYLKSYYDYHKNRVLHKFSRPGTGILNHNIEIFAHELTLFNDQDGIPIDPYFNELIRNHIEKSRLCDF